MFVGLVLFLLLIRIGVVWFSYLIVDIGLKFSEPKEVFYFGSL